MSGRDVLGLDERVSVFAPTSSHAFDSSSVRLFTSWVNVLVFKAALNFSLGLNKGAVCVNSGLDVRTAAASGAPTGFLDGDSGLDVCVAQVSSAPTGSFDGDRNDRASVVLSDVPTLGGESDDSGLDACPVVTFWAWTSA